MFLPLKMSMQFNFSAENTNLEKILSFNKDLLLFIFK